MNGNILCFETLHSENRPTGKLGRGTHYSVLRTLAWSDVNFQPIRKPLYHDLAVIWDEDHDERVFEFIRALYLDGSISPALFVGERKGFVSLIVSNDCSTETLEQLSVIVETIAQDLDDPWSSEVVRLSSLEQTIIHDEPAKVQLYLNTINMLWSLGLKSAVSSANGGKTSAN